MSTSLSHRPTENRNAAFRWHFYAAWFVLPILLVLAITGLIILLKPTLERTFYGDMLYVDKVSNPLSLDLQRDSVLDAFDFAIIDAVVPPRDVRRSTQFDITDVDGKSLSVYVNPANGSILGFINNDTRLDFVATRIHGTMWMGTWGDYLIEVASGWTLVMCATGLFLWFPRRWIPGSLRRAFIPRIRSKGRKPWRDVHGVFGMIAAPLLVFLVVTGLPWTGFWGERIWYPLIDSLEQGVNYPAEEPTSNLDAEELESAGLSITWASGMSSVPNSANSTQEPISLEKVAQLATNESLLPGYGIGIPTDEYGVYTLTNAWPSRAQEERIVFLDQYSGKVLDEVGWTASYGLLARATSWGVDAHMGRQLGVANGIVMGVVCLAAIGSCITAPIVYLKRRRRGSLSLPAHPTAYRPPIAIRFVAMAISILYPLFGLSFVMVLAVDRLLVRQVRGTPPNTENLANNQ